MEPKSIFIIAAQFGGGEALSFKPVFLEFKRLLERNFKTKYSVIIHELSIIFRIDGTISSWEKKGVNRMRLMKSKNYITIDIGVTKDVLKMQKTEIWRFVWKEFEVATFSMTKKLKASKIDFNYEQFEADLFTFKKDYNLIEK
jgi:hypothetical protein